MNDFKVGDTVELKSGSPLMTVTCVSDPQISSRSIACAWFDEFGRLCRDLFEPGCLRIINATF